MQVLPLVSKHKVLHFNRTDTRLANNLIPHDLQRLRCRVNFQALKFTPKIEALGHKLVHILQEKGPFVTLHLRYEMDMLAFSGCTHGCTAEEAEELKRLRLVVFYNLTINFVECSFENQTVIITFLMMTCLLLYKPYC